MTDKEKIKELLVGMASSEWCDNAAKRKIHNDILPLIDSLPEKPELTKFETELLSIMADYGVEKASDDDIRKEANRLLKIARSIPVEWTKDEKIRKELITIISCAGDDSSHIYISKRDSERYVAWLEKQGEQKPADKVKPKFREGDWVFIEEIKGYKQGAFQIKSVDEFGYIFDEYHTIPFMYEDLLSKWTIQDAKDGDVLYLQKDGKEHIIIYKGVLKERFRTFVSAYCAYNGIVDAFCFADVSRYVDIAYRGIMPATKEQRDQLEKAMADAGYTFDFEKKELKKVEQKPTDLKTKAGNWYICDMEVMNESINSAFHRDEIYYCPKDGYLDVGGALFEVGCLDVFRLATEKEIPQPKHEWNEEDSRILGNLKSELTNLVARGLIKRETEDKYVSWLDSLKPKNRWKPSRGQIEALDHAINCYATISPTHKEDIGALMLMKERLKELTD